MREHALTDCSYRQRCDGKTYCKLVAEIAAPQDRGLTEVSGTACEMCSTFFAPTKEEPNPLVASLLDDVAEATGNERLKCWGARFRRTGLYPETVDEEGFVVRDKEAVCNSHAEGEPPHEPCIYLVRRREQAVGEGEHRSGWPNAFDALSDLHCKHGIAFDDFIEERFGYHMGSPGYREPWIGIFHHPLDDPGFAGKRNNLNEMMLTAYWRDAEPWLRGVITLSEHLASQLRQRLSDLQLDVPVTAIKHPVGIPNQQWTIERFAANPRKKLIQMGWYQRNTQAIYSVPPVSLKKYRILPCRPLHGVYDALVREKFAAGAKRYDCRVIERVWIHPDEYESALTENVMFTHMITASANNIVVDCIAANTPLIINPHPAVVEYLGNDYPLYYTDFEDVPGLCQDDCLIAANKYLRCLDKSWASADVFRDSVANAVRLFSGAT